MGHSLKMQCPHCKKVRKQGIEGGTGDSKLYYSGTVKTLVGEEFLGRLRTRHCTNCGTMFQTIEQSLYGFNVTENKLQELNDQKINAEILANLAKCRAKKNQRQYEDEMKKTQNLQKQVDYLQKIIMDLGGPIQQINNVLAAESIEDCFPLKDDKPYVDHEKKDDDEDNLLAG